MYFVGVISDGKNFDNINASIKSHKEKIKMIKINLKTIENLQNIKFDLIVINDNLDKFKNQINLLKKICSNTKYIALNADIQVKENLTEFAKTKIITYGLNSKATVTVSSIKEEDCLIYLQRNIENIEKEVIEIGEKHIYLNQESKILSYNILIIYIISFIFNIK